MTEQDLIEMIPARLAADAFQAQSFDPEKRGEGARRLFSGLVLEARDDLAKHCETDDQRAALDAEISALAPRVAGLFRDWLASEARCMSPMITGPANFPVARNEKRRESAENKRRAVQELLERAKASILRRVFPHRPGVGIQSDAPEAVDILKARLVEMVALRDAKKAGNAAYKRGGEAALIAAVGEELAAEGMSTIRLMRAAKPFPWLSNDGARIRATEQRIARLEETRAKAASMEAETGSAEMEKPFPGGVLVEDWAADRLRLVFDAKPTPETIAALKRNGFRWAPSEGAWQRQLTNAARHAATRVLPVNPYAQAVA